MGESPKGCKKNLKENGISIKIDTISTTISFEKWEELLREEVEKEYFEELTSAIESLKEGQCLQRDSIQKIGESFLNAFSRNSFVEALSAWTNAPSLDGTIKHSGLVHFIEYRSSEQKDRHHHINVEFSPEGFEKYTENIIVLINDPKSVEVNEAMKLRDEYGNERLIIYTKDKSYISAFKAKDTAVFRIINQIPDMEKKDWENTKLLMQNSEAQKNYHNKLEGNIEVLPL